MKTKLLLLLASLALWSGCATQSVNSVERASPRATPTAVVDQRVITDSSLARKLTIVSVNETYVSGDLLQVQAVVENTTRSPKDFVYKFDWISQNGMEVSSTASTWRSLRLQGGERSSISAVAKTPSAVDFRLKIQER
jgi:uncharacterized protein YcfL